MYKLGPTQGTTNMGIIYIGSFVRHFLQNLHNNTRASSLTQFSMELKREHKSFHYDGIFFGTYTKTWVSSLITQFSMELTQNTRVSIMMTFSLELIQTHEFQWPNFLWNLHTTQEFPLWWHFLWNLHTNMSFFFYGWILYGTYITQFVWLFFKIQYFPL